MERRPVYAAVALVCVVVFLSACGGDSRTPLAPTSPIVPPQAGVSGAVYMKTSSGRTPAEGVHVDVIVQVQSGPFTGYTSRVEGGYTNSVGAFHVDSAPIGARILVTAHDSSSWNLCMAYVENYQGSANVEIDLYPKTESEEWIVDSTLAGRRPILTGSATATGAPQPDGFIYFEAVYESYIAESPIDRDGRYAFCGLPVNLMFPSRVWIENGAWSCDRTGHAYAFHAIHPHSSTDNAVRDFAVHQCSWGNRSQGLGVRPSQVRLP